LVSYQLKVFLGFSRQYFSHNLSPEKKTTKINTFRFGIISSLVVFIYATHVQNVDPEEYGGIVEIIKEGFMTAFATFLVRKYFDIFR
jgi:hypothetical protein